MILDGHKLQQQLLPSLREGFAKLSQRPVLAIVCVGDRADSKLYISKKVHFGFLLGVEVSLIALPATSSTSDIQAKVELLNIDSSITGVIVQLPLPDEVDEVAVVESISPEKDVDGLTGSSLKKLMAGDLSGSVPATAKAVFSLLDHYKIEVAGKHLVVVGRSMLVGQPIALMAISRDATVTICHSLTRDLSHITALADIVVSATGHPGLIDSGYVRPGQAVIDVGISMDIEDPTGKIKGDVDRVQVEPVVNAVSPVPGGVGPMTVFFLFDNLLKICQSS